jgi:hypothetical protein
MPNLRDKITNPDKGTSHAAVQKNATMANPSHGNSNNRSKEEEAALTKRLEALEPPDEDGQSQQRGKAGGPSPEGAANAAGGMPNSHGSVPGGGGQLPPLKPKVSEEARKSQHSLHAGVAGVVGSQRGSAETPPAGDGKRTRHVYDAEKASAVQKKIQNLKDVWHETEETEDKDETRACILEIINAGPNFKLVDAWGRTPAENAHIYGMPDIVSLIKRAELKQRFYKKK